jgi:hypothetical protein
MTFYMRRRFGMFWQKNRPPMPWRPLAVIVACMLAYSAVAKYDRLEHRAKKMEREMPVYQSYRDVVLAAMNGDARFQVGNELFECRGGKL